MFITSQAMVIPILGNITAGELSPGTGETIAKVGLFTNNVTVTPTTVLSVLTEADFTGYAQASLGAWGDPSLVNSSESQVLNTSVMQWAGPSDSSGQTCYGYFLLNKSGVYLGGENFPAGVPLVNPTDVISLLPQWTYKVPVDVTFVVS